MATTPEDLTTRDTTGMPSGTSGESDGAGFSALKTEAKNLASTATTAVKNAAATGKDKAATALDDVARLAEDAARTLDEKLGGTVGEYARSASSTVANLSMSLKNKEVDELVDDAKELIRRNPAVAVGAAAAIGFILTRLIRIGSEPDYQDGRRDGRRDDRD